jgi:hypothetical protein
MGTGSLYSAMRGEKMRKWKRKKFGILDTKAVLLVYSRSQVCSDLKEQGLFLRYFPDKNADNVAGIK